MFERNLSPSREETLVLIGAICLMTAFLLLGLASPNEAHLDALRAAPLGEELILHEDLALDLNVYEAVTPPPPPIKITKEELKRVPKAFLPAVLKNHEFAKGSQVLKHPSKDALAIEVQVTAYGWGEPNNLDATGRRLKPGIIALSPDLVKEFGFKFGQIIHLEGHGDFEYRDHMAKYLKRRVDIFMDAPKSDVLKFGVRHDRIILELKEQGESKNEG